MCENVFNFYRVNEDIKGLIYKEIHRGNQLIINEAINNIIGFNIDYIKKWKNTNQLYLLINKYFVIRKQPNKFNNRYSENNENQEIKQYSGNWNGLFVLSYLNNRDMPYLIKKSNFLLDSFNLKVLESYFEKNLMYSLLLTDIYKFIDGDNILKDNHIYKYNGTITKCEKYIKNEYINDLNDYKKNLNYIDLLFNSNSLINPDFLRYTLNIYDNTNFTNLSTIIKFFNSQILEIHLLENDLNTRTGFYRTNDRNDIVDLKYKYKVDLQDLMFINHQKSWKRLTKKQLIKRLLLF